MNSRTTRRGVAAVVMGALLAACSATTTNDTTGSTGGTSARSVGTVDEAKLVDGIPPWPACSGQPASTPVAGVTADTVKVGVMYPDPKPMASIGFGIDVGPVAEAYKALLEAPNADGGICGRKLEATVALYNALSPGDDAKACSKLTEDDKQFVVFAGGGATSSSLSCLSGQGKTLTMTETAQVQAFADGVDDRMFSLSENWDVSLASIPTILQKANLLQGKVGLMYGASGESDVFRKAVEERLIPAMKSAGIDAETCSMPAPASTAEGAAAIPLCVEQFVGAGVNTLVTAVDIYSLAMLGNEANKQGLKAKYVNVAQWPGGAIAKLLFSKVSKPEYFDGLVTTALETGNGYPPAYQAQCLEKAKKAGIDIAPLNDFQKQFMGAICYRVDMTLWGIASAGNTASQESFIAGLQQIPPFVTPPGISGSWAKDKNFLADELCLVQYNASTDTTKPYGDGCYAFQ